MRNNTYDVKKLSPDQIEDLKSGKEVILEPAIYEITDNIFLSKEASFRMSKAELCSKSDNPGKT